MHAIILCAGYAVRLYPLTQNTPKPLLPVGDRPMLDHLVDKINHLKEFDTIDIVTNAKFSGHFENWAKQKNNSKKIVIINDGSTTNESRLGAIGDLNLVLNRQKIQDDVLILAGDNFFTFDLGEFLRLAQEHNSFASIGLYDVKSKTLARNYGLVELDRDDKIKTFLEKPENPQTTLASTGIYYFPKEVLALLDQYLSEKNSTDAPGYFVQWLIKHSSVFGVLLTGFWFDIGDLASYEQVKTWIKSKTV